MTLGGQEAENQVNRSDAFQFFCMDSNALEQGDKLCLSRFMKDPILTMETREATEKLIEISSL